MLLSNLDLLATAPGGVARLRELILTLAVQGKLMPQEPADEPASVLLQKIREEKDRLIAEGKIRRNKSLAEIAEEEKPFGLPVGWAFCRLGDLLLSIRSGGTPSKQNPGYWNGEIPWASVKDLRFGEPISETQDWITQAGLDAGSELAPAGSILICTRMGLGKIGEALIDVAINQDLKAVQLGAGIKKQYFINYFKTLAVVGSGMTVAGIKQDELLGFLVPLPPEVEQSRIVTRVEELMSLCDALEAKGQLEATQHAQLVSTLLGALTTSATPEDLADNWQRVAQHFDLLLDRPQAIDALEQTLLQLAVRGLLAPQDPTDEPASALLQKIRAEKDRLIAAGQIKRDKPLPPITAEEKPFELPVGWEWVRLGLLTSLVTSGSRSWKDFYAAEGATFIRSQDIKYDRLEFDERAFVKLPAGTEGVRTQVRLHDLLITITGANVGKAAVVSEPISEAYVSQHVALVRLLNVSMLDCIHLWLVSEYEGRKLLLMSSYGAKPGLNLQNINDLLIPLPPLAEQSRIVTCVTALRQLCSDLRQRLAECQSVQARLAEALVASVA